MTSPTPKPVIILIHGGASSQRMYKTTIPLLTQKGFTCLSPDLPGHGTNAKSGPFTFEAAQAVISTCINDYISSQTAASLISIHIVGISLGGQVTLSFLQNLPLDLSPGVNLTSVLVSGTSIYPPDEYAGFEMPHLPSDQTWMDILMDDVQLAGMENMADLQAKSMAFTFDVETTKARFASVGREVPPIQVMIGEHDVGMARRDFGEITEMAKGLNIRSEGKVLEGAWHNHSIDVPEKFVDAVIGWVEKCSS